MACPLIELDRVLQQHPPHHAAARVHTNGVAQQRAGGTGVRAPPTLRTARLPQAGKHEVSLSLLSRSLSLWSSAQIARTRTFTAHAHAQGMGMGMRHRHVHGTRHGTQCVSACVWGNRAVVLRLE